MNVTQGQLKRFYAGTITANGTTEVTLNYPGLQADSLVIPSLNTVGGTPNNIYVSTKTVGAAGVIGFKSAASNTSTYDIYVFS